jgi:protein-disulfide isomerase
VKPKIGTRITTVLPRFVFTVLCIATLGIGAVSAEESFSPDETKAIEDIVRDLLRNNPEILLEAIQNLRRNEEVAQQGQARQNILARRNELFGDPTSPVGGNPDGDVTIVEFFDYQCGFCKRVFPTVQTLLKNDDGIRYVFKEFPILGPVSIFAARAALAGWKQGREKYIAFHAAMMTAKGKLSEARVMRFARDVGLDVDRLKRDMATGQINDMIKETLKLAEGLQINGTPAFVIGDTLVPGAANLDTLKSLVERARKTEFKNLM